MFAGYVSGFLETDPEFIELFDNFAFDEVINMPDIGGKEVDGRIRHIALLATLLGCQGIDEFKAMVPAAMNFGVTPVEIKEITYQAAANMRNGNDKLFLIKIISHCLPFIGYPRSLNALACVNKAAEQSAE